MTALPKISVVMSAYNSELTIREAIDSILKQSYSEFEFLIIDDGSTDNTRAIIEEFSDSRIRVIYNDNNIGLTRSLNKAISLAAGEFIARQDADDISLPERFRKQLEFMNNNPDVVLLGTSRATLDSLGQTIAINTLAKEPTHNDLLKKNYFVHGSVMLRKKVLDEVGVYDEFFRQSQDYELWLRVSRKHRVMNIQEPLYAVRRHGNRVTLTKLPQAMLYRLMASHLARGIISPEAVAKIRQNGIESFYDYLSKKDKQNFHKKAAQKYFKHKFYIEAENHFRLLRKLDPCSASAAIGLACVKLKSISQ